MLKNHENLLGDLLKEFRAFWGFSGKAESEGSLHSKMVRFLIFLQKLFFWTHEPPISDLGGRGPSPGVLKQYPQIKSATAKLLGTLLKEFRGLMQKNRRTTQSWVFLWSSITFCEWEIEKVFFFTNSGQFLLLIKKIKISATPDPPNRR